ncbi:protein WEAK CHLOROPLAST MOVEMENT UNDER BLUE LIGHT-like 1 [Nicotiana tomentosiformis]|uniref:protein WEAK CHLOROPLAST MOVEMENT UNDER BLUE LIGHT-like 1 n=1 Tax=Nicotiana tomentosiformis TaxID=4098 RepID=UPI00388CA0A8
MSSDSIRQLRDESEEDEEGNSELVARMRADVSVQEVLEPTSAEVEASRHEEVGNGALVEASEPERVKPIPPQAKGVERESGEGTPIDELRAVDLSGSPQISDSMIREAGMLSPQGVTDIHDFLDGVESAALEDVTRIDDLPVSRKESSSSATGLFNEAQQALNRASVLYYEAFLRYREEFTYHEAEVRDLTEKSDTYKLLSEKLQADLVTARAEHAEMDEQVFRVLHDSEDELKILTNDPILQLRQRLEQIGELQKQVDTIHAEAEEFKKNMDILVSKKETVQTQLESAKTQLQATKEKVSVQVEKIKKLQSRLDLAVFDKANLASELEVARSEVAVANTKADTKVAQFKVYVEAIQAKSKSMVDHAKWQARREALGGVHPQGFDVMAEIENTKAKENRARKLAFPEEDSDG